MITRKLSFVARESGINPGPNGGRTLVPTSLVVHLNPWVVICGWNRVESSYTPPDVTAGRKEKRRKKKKLAHLLYVLFIPRGYLRVDNPG